jgi:hypothetical protein
MADTTTTNFELVKPEVGASTDTWGTKLNDNFDVIDSAMQDNADAAAAALAAAEAMAPGKILQVVQGTSNTAVSITAKTYAETQLSAAITPSLASSKILVLVDHQIDIRANAASAAGGLRLLRGSTVIYTASQGASDGPYGLAAFSINSGGSPHGMSTRVQINVLDSPNTTDAVTYKTQGAVGEATNGETLTINYDGSTVKESSRIILMEVAA